MAKNGFLSALPFLAAPAALATGGLLAPALFGAEAAGLGAGEVAGATAGGLGAGEAAGAAAPFFIPGTETAIPGISAGVADIGGAAAGASPFFVPGTDTPLPSSAGAFDAGSAQISGAVPTATQAIGAAGPVSDFTGGTVGSGNAFGLPPGSQVSGEQLLSATNPIDPADAPGPALDLAGGVTLSPEGGTDFTGTRDEGDLLSRIGAATSNPAARAGLAGAGLLASGLMNTGTVPGSQPITRAAGTATQAGGNFLGQANQNLSALNTGALPAGAQSAIDQANRSAKATIRSQYAGMGLGNSTSEAQALAAVDQQSATQKLGEAEKLTTLGLREAGLAGNEQALASEDYLALMNARVRQDDRLANALARFSGALAGSTGSQV